MRPVGLEEAGRDVDAELGGEMLHRQHRLVLVRGPRIGEQALVLDPAEIFAFEQFGRQHDLRAPARRLADEFGHRLDVGVRYRW